MRDFQDRTVIMEEVRLIYRNFAGRESMYNAEGDRNFAVLLDDEVAAKLQRDGWHVKHIKPATEDDEPQPYLPVALKFGGRRPPLVVLITKIKGEWRKTQLSEEDLPVLDWVDIMTADLIVRPFEWAVGGKSGIKAYLNEIYITIRENRLVEKYSEVLELDELPASAGAIEDVVDGEVVSTNDVLELER